MEKFKWRKTLLLKWCDNDRYDRIVGSREAGKMSTENADLYAQTVDEALLQGDCSGADRVTARLHYSKISL